MSQGEYLDADGVSREADPDLSWADGRPALFLDRDGVVVEDTDYLHCIADVAMIPGAAAFIREANSRAIPVVMLSNQAGIGRGYFGWPEFHTVQRFIAARLMDAGAKLNIVLACPHYPRHRDRKPEPGMFWKAAKMGRLDLRRSWVIGDKASDLEAGRAAGLAGGILVLTGHGLDHRESAEALRTPSFEVREEPSIANAGYVLDYLG